MLKHGTAAIVGSHDLSLFSNSLTPIDFSQPWYCKLAWMISYTLKKLLSALRQGRWLFRTKQVSFNMAVEGKVNNGTWIGSWLKPESRTGYWQLHKAETSGINAASLRTRKRQGIVFVWNSPLPLKGLISFTTQLVYCFSGWRKWRRCYLVPSCLASAR